MCHCGEYYGVHHPNCPVVREFAELRERVAELVAENADPKDQVRAMLAGRGLHTGIMQALKDAEKSRLRLLGALAILVEDEIISSGRARELGAMTIEEQRAYLRQVLAP